ncbi:MAG: sugar phosphate nucleotidyltransferase [Thermoproteota archaeon]
MKVVITAAGLGTRLLPMSKELPKEMLPIFVKSDRGFILKPLLQALFEQLYEFGFREFCFVVGRGKRSIEDHFTPDRDFVRRLGISGKSEFVSDLEHFYDMIESSRIIFINQPEPRGFGHAVLMAKTFVGREPFMVCAGDTYIISKDKKFLKRMMDVFSYDVTAVLLLQKVSDPRLYGVKSYQFPRQGMDPKKGWTWYVQHGFLKSPTTVDLHLSWDVPYEPGVLKAVGKNGDEAVCIHEVITSGEPARIGLTVNRENIAADGRDCVHITVQILDDKGNIVPTADNLVILEVGGEGRLIGVDNGDPTSHEDFKSNQRKAFNGLCLAIVQSTEAWQDHGNR